MKGGRVTSTTTTGPPNCWNRTSTESRFCYAYLALPNRHSPGSHAQRERSAVRGRRAFVTRDSTNASCGRPESSFVAQPTRAAATERYAAARHLRQLSEEAAVLERRPLFAAAAELRRRRLAAHSGRRSEPCASPVQSGRCRPPMTPRLRPTSPGLRLFSNTATVKQSRSGTPDLR